MLHVRHAASAMQNERPSISFSQASRGCRSTPTKQGSADDAADLHPLDLGNRLGGVQTLRTGFGAVHDRVATIELEGIFQRIQTLARGFIAAVNNPAVRLH